MQRLLSEQLGHVLPHALQQARAFHIGQSGEGGFADRLAVGGGDHFADHGVAKPAATVSALPKLSLAVVTAVFG